MNKEEKRYCDFFEVTLDLNSVFSKLEKWSMIAASIKKRHLVSDVKLILTIQYRIPQKLNQLSRNQALQFQYRTSDNYQLVRSSLS